MMQHTQPTTHNTRHIILSLPSHVFQALESKVSELTATVGTLQKQLMMAAKDAAGTSKALSER
jgi:hypothetical protein